jgi:hypothetical protein
VSKLAKYDTCTHGQGVPFSIPGKDVDDIEALKRDDATSCQRSQAETTRNDADNQKKSQSRVGKFYEKFVKNCKKCDKFMWETVFSPTKKLSLMDMDSNSLQIEKSETWRQMMANIVWRHSQCKNQNSWEEFDDVKNDQNEVVCHVEGEMDDAVYFKANDDQQNRLQL